MSYLIGNTEGWSFTICEFTKNLKCYTFSPKCNSVQDENSNQPNSTWSPYLRFWRTNQYDSRWGIQNLQVFCSSGSYHSCSYHTVIILDSSFHCHKTHRGKRVTKLSYSFVYSPTFKGKIIVKIQHTLFCNVNIKPFGLMLWGKNKFKKVCS